MAKLKDHDWFGDVNWELMQELGVKPPFEPDRILMRHMSWKNSDRRITH